MEEVDDVLQELESAFKVRASLLRRRRRLTRASSSATIARAHTSSPPLSMHARFVPYDRLLLLLLLNPTHLMSPAAPVNLIHPLLLSLRTDNLHTPQKVYQSMDTLLHASKPPKCV